MNATINPFNMSQSETIGHNETKRQVEITLVGYVLIRRLGYKLKDVAKCLGRDIATVSSLVSRYSDRMAKRRRFEEASDADNTDCLESKAWPKDLWPVLLAPGPWP